MENRQPGNERSVDDRLFNHRGTTSRGQPVIQPQAGNILEIRRVVRHQSQVVNQSDGGNHQVRSRDADSLLEQPATFFAEPLGTRMVVIQNHRIVEQLPDVGGGAFGVARMAKLLHQRLTPSQGERPGRPTNPTWVSRPKVPMSKATAQKLQKLATALSTPRRKVSPMQIAAQLLEEALARVE